ncbi:glycosyltransferase [Fontibacter flavus]|uniref:Glycosyltransferase n=1 Tax=Fontibacter flavus TaxID=654838 RepID=A0ABV6FUE7_9BACT
MKIRVLHCIETIASGGVEQVRLTLIKGLDKGKFEHKIVCTWAGGYVADSLEKEGVELIPIGVFKSILDIRKYGEVLRIIKEFKPHIIHGAIFEGMAMAAISGNLGKVPVIILEETSDPVYRSQKAIWLQRFLVKLSDKIIGISPNVCNFLIKKAKIHPNKVHLINNGVSIPSVDFDQNQIEALKSKLKISSGDFIIGAVGRVLDVVKRFSDILKALQKIDNPKVKFLLVGDGQDLNQLKNLAIDLGVEKQFLTVGYQSKTTYYYLIMDVFCVPSANEGFGLVAVEAMFFRLPVIGTKVGGLQDIVVDNQTGFLIPPNSPQEIAEKIQYLIDFPETSKSMGENGYERAMEHYTADRYCRKVEDLYLELLKKKGIIE